MQFTVLCSVELFHVVRLSAKFDFDYSFLIVCGKILKVFGMTLAIQSKEKFCQYVFYVFELNIYQTAIPHFDKYVYTKYDINVRVK